MSYRLPVIRQAHEAFDVRVRETMVLAAKEGHRSPCKRGCSACCSEPLYVSQYELPPIIEAIRAMSPEQQNAIACRLAWWRGTLEGKGVSESVDETDLDFEAWHQQPKPVCP